MLSNCTKDPEILKLMVGLEDLRNQFSRFEKKNKFEIVKQIFLIKGKNFQKTINELNHAIKEKDRLTKSEIQNANEKNEEIKMLMDHFANF